MHCEIEKDECQSGPCLNGGTCEDLLGGYVCHCIVPYGGRLCEIENTCLPNPCMNGGSCVFNVADETHACSCVRGFTGRACEINIDDCLTDDVCFGGQCVDGVNGFHCNCSGANGTTLTNIARNKWAIQSSTHQDNYASRAVDDVINPDSSGGLSCAITGNQTGEAGWWKVDLGQVYCVSRVTISTPQDCCAGSISEAEVRVSRHYDMSDPNVCGIVHDTMASDWLIDIECALGAVGRYLEIRRLLGDRESLALCEVKVMVPEGFHEIPPVADSVECPSDWKPFGDKCYYFGTNQLTWTDADVYCQSQGGISRKIHERSMIFCRQRLQS
ncbi:uncharacterized protein [Ptychodera flava]|uniref:uncharacterized protein n=1 Tax=Ptychodera flava TaxID=63121 RepID=UPI003969F54D